MILEVTLPQGVPAFSQRVELNGTEYVLTFDWIGRAERWVFSIADTEENELVSGIALVIGWPLLGRFVGDSLPRGELYAIDTTGAHLEAGLNDLGARVKLLYFDAEEMAGLLA